MAQKISRRNLANHVAGRLRAGDGSVVEELAAYLVDMRLVRELDLYVREIESALAQSGLVVADVHSARELSAKTKKSIEKHIKDSYKAKSVEMREIVDAQLVGGVRVRTPDAEYDATVRRKLTKLQTMKV